MRWAALLLAPVLTFLLVAIDEIGVQLEEPFAVLPLDRICDRIRSNTAEIVAFAAAARALVGAEGTLPGGLPDQLVAAKPL